MTSRLRSTGSDDGAHKTYVVKNQWGPSTEPTLALLTESFPDAKVSYERADTDDYRLDRRRRGENDTWCLLLRALGSLACELWAAATAAMPAVIT